LDNTAKSHFGPNGDVGNIGVRLALFADDVERLEKIMNVQAAMLGKTGGRLRNHEFALGTALTSSLTQGSGNLRR